MPPCADRHDRNDSSAAGRNLRPGHIPGTSQHDLPENDENRRDLSRRPEHMVGTSTLVRNTGAPDPAYGPTRLVPRPPGKTLQVRPMTRHVDHR